MAEIVLRDYQSTDIVRIRETFREFVRRVLYVSPTGSGKTTLFVEIARLCTNKQQQTLIVVHRKELIKQVSNRLGVFGIEHGVVAEGYKPRPEFAVQVVMVLRAPRLLATFKPALIIVDEAHHAVAASYKKMLDAAPGARVLGVTATPCRLDGRSLGDAFDVIVEGPSVSILTEQGYLVPAIIYAPSQPDLSKAGRRGGDFKREDIASAVEKSSVTGDAVEHYKRLCAGLRSVAFCVDAAHAKRTAAEFNAAGVPADIILSAKYQSASERERVVRDLETGKILVLCSVDVVSEGFDIPEISVVILLRPTASFSLFRQQIGRGLRPYPGKIHAIILDHAGNVLRHGFPDDEVIWSLTAEVKRKSPDDLLKLKRCSSCLMIYRSSEPVCPYCAHKENAAARQKILEREGMLAKFDKQIRDEMKREEQARKNEFKRDAAQAATRQDLMAVAKKHGKGNFWAIQKFKKSSWRQASSHHKNKCAQSLDIRKSVHLPKMIFQ